VETGKEGVLIYITGQNNTSRLNQMVKDYAAIDAALTRKIGPRPCCAEFGAVTKTGDRDTVTCGCCGRVWEAPCR